MMGQGTLTPITTPSTTSIPTKPNPNKITRTGNSCNSYRVGPRVNKFKPYAPNKHHQPNKLRKLQTIYPDLGDEEKYHRMHQNSWYQPEYQPEDVLVRRTEHKEPQTLPSQSLKSSHQKNTRGPSSRNELMTSSPSKNKSAYRASKEVYDTKQSFLSKNQDKQHRTKAGKSVPGKSTKAVPQRSTQCGASYDRWDTRTPIVPHSRKYKIPSSAPDSLMAGLKRSSTPVGPEAKPMRSLTWRSPKRQKVITDWRSYLPPAEAPKTAPILTMPTIPSPEPKRPELKSNKTPKPELNLRSKKSTTEPTINHTIEPINQYMNPPNLLPHLSPFSQLTDQQMLRLSSNEKQVYDTLEHQMDIEIYNKQKELAMINEELAIGYKLLNKFEGGLRDPVEELVNPVNTRPQNSNIDNELKKASRLGAEMLFARWEDGVFVRIVCPKCGRGNFRDPSLFLSHLQKLHNIEYPTLKEAYASCGIPVANYQVPLDHPCRAEAPLVTPPDSNFEYGCVSVMYKKFQESRAQLYLEKPKIKVYNEDIDMSTWNNPPPPVKPSPIPLTMAVENENEEEYENEHDESASQDKQLMEEIIEPIPSKTVACQSSLMYADPPSSMPLPGQDDSVAAVLGLEETSRFHVRKKIVFGNVSKLVSTVENSDEPNFFRWLAYVSGPSYAPDLSSFISKVKFILHPSYAPHDVVELTSPPFQVSRLGWGEFPIRVLLTFHDPRNKSIELIHNLTLGSGLELHESEDHYEVELDRATEFLSQNSKPIHPPTPSESEDALPSTDKHFLLTRLIDSFPLISPEPVSHLPYQPAESAIQLAAMHKDDLKLLEERRAECILSVILKEKIFIEPLSLAQVLLDCRTLDSHLACLTSFPTEGLCSVCGKSCLLVDINRCSVCQEFPSSLTSLSSAQAILDELSDSEDDFIVVDDQCSSSCLTADANYFTHLAQSEVPSPIDPAELQFVNDAVSELDCPPLNNTSCSAISLATRLFLNTLVTRVLNTQFPDRQPLTPNHSVRLNPSDARPPTVVNQVITPVHVWNSLTSADPGNLDFLTNAFSGA